jgi:hypothetical protein
VLQFLEQALDKWRERRSLRDDKQSTQCDKEEHHGVIHNRKLLALFYGGAAGVAEYPSEASY